MFLDHTIQLNFSLLDEFATAASKQFKIVERCMKISINSELENYLRFPSKQLCLEILAQGFGFDDFKAAKEDRKVQDMRPFKFPVDAMEKFFHKHNSELETGRGYFAEMWIKWCVKVFQNTFCLKHSLLNLYNEVKIAKFDNYALIYQIAPFAELLPNAMGELEDAACESEDSLFLLNFLALIVEEEEIMWLDRRTEQGIERTLSIRNKHIYRIKPTTKDEKSAIDYGTDIMFDCNLAVFVVETVGSSNFMQVEHSVHLTEEAYKSMMYGRKAGRVMDWCKKRLDMYLEKDLELFGFESLNELNATKNKKYRILLRQALVDLGLFRETGNGNLIEMAEAVFGYKTESGFTRAFNKKIKDGWGTELVSSC